MLLEWTLWILSTVSVAVAKALVVRWLMAAWSRLYCRRVPAEPYFTITVSWKE